MSGELNSIEGGATPLSVDKKNWWDKEKRKEYTKREKEISKQRAPAWTPEKREAARLRGIATIKKTLDEHQRLLRRTKTRYIKSVITGEIFVWTKNLAERKDMVEVCENEIHTTQKKSL